MKSKEIVLFVTKNNKIISSSKRTSQALVNHNVKYRDTYKLIFFHKIHIKGKEIVLFVKKSNHQRS